MPAITAIAIMVGDGDMVTSTAITATATPATWTYDSGQDKVEIRNLGKTNLVVSIGDQYAVVIDAYGVWAGDLSFNSFTIQTTSGTQDVRVISTRRGEKSRKEWATHLDVRDFGAKCDGGSSEGGTIAAGAVVTDATPNDGLDPKEGQPVTFVGMGSAVGGGITGVTKAVGANPVITTATAHGLQNGQQITIAGVVGATQVNGVWTVSGVTATTFAVRLNIEAISAFTSGGTVRPTVYAFGYIKDLQEGASRSFTIASVPGGAAVAVPGGLTSGQYFYGTDDTQAWDLVIAAANKVGALEPRPVTIKWVGVSMVSDLINLNGNMVLEGDNAEYTNPDGSNSLSNLPTRGSIIRAHGNFNNAISTQSVVVQLGVVASDTHSGMAGASMRDCTVDAANIVSNAVQTNGSRNYLERVYALNGTNHAFNILGSNTVQSYCLAGMANTGDGVYIANSDYKWMGGYVRQCTNAFRIAAGNNITIGGGVHIFNGYNGGNEQYGTDVLVDANTNDVTLLTLGEVVYDGVIGYHVRIAPAANKKVQGVNIIGGKFFQPQSFGDLYAGVIQIDTSAAGVQVSDIDISGYNVRGKSGTARYKSILDTIGTLAFRINLGAGNGYWCAEHYTGQRPTTISPNIPLYDGTNTLASSVDAETSGLTGNGVLTTFSVAHGLSQIPKAVTFAPKTAASVGAFYTADATNIVFTFAAAPANAAALGFGYSATI